MPFIWLLKDTSEIQRKTGNWLVLILLWVIPMAIIGIFNLRLHISDYAPLWMIGCWIEAIAIAVMIILIMLAIRHHKEKSLNVQLMEQDEREKK